MMPQANPVMWAVVGAVLAAIYNIANVNLGLIDGLRSQQVDIPDLGFFGTVMLWAVIAGLVAVLRNWWRQER